MSKKTKKIILLIIIIAIIITIVILIKNKQKQNKYKEYEPDYYEASMILADILIKKQEYKTLYTFKIPENIDYNTIDHISTETKEKLSKIRPKNLAQASRIGGVKPADISILMVMLDKHMIKS